MIDMTEPVARAWASIDGKAKWFDDDKTGKRLDGTYEGYMAEARELLKRSGMAAALAEAQSRATDQSENARYWLEQHNKQAKLVEEYATAAKVARARIAEIEPRLYHSNQSLQKTESALAEAEAMNQSAAICRNDDFRALRQRCEKAERELDEVRTILASTDIVSLPNDYPLSRMAHDRMERIKDLTLHGLAEIGRVEKAEAALAEAQLYSRMLEADHVPKARLEAAEAALAEAQRERDEERTGHKYWLETASIQHARAENAERELAAARQWATAERTARETAEARIAELIGEITFIGDTAAHALRSDDDDAIVLATIRDRARAITAASAVAQSTTGPIGDTDRQGDP